MTATDPTPPHTACSGQVSALRTLPLRVAPVRGEVLESWLQALAHRSGATWGDIIAATGCQSGQVARARRPISMLTDHQLAGLTFTTGVSAQTVRAMTPSSLLPDPHSPTELRVLLMPGSRFCPRCLHTNGGRWLLWWRLRWAFACPTHRCLLADYCPACRRRPRIEAPPIDLVPQPARCDRPALGARGRPVPARCSALLSDPCTTGAETDDAVLHAQHRILDAITTGKTSDGIYRGGTVSALAYVTDLRVLGEQLLHHTTCDAPSVIALNRSATPAWALNRDSTCAGTAALGASLAVPILDCTTPVEAAQLLGTMLVPHSRDTVARHLRHSCGVSAAAARLGLAVKSTGTAVEQLRIVPISHPAARCATERHHSVPALLWSTVAYPFVLQGLGFERLRHALSVAVLLVGNEISLEQACARLGNPYPTRSVTRALQHLHTQPMWPHCLATLARLADTMERTPPPIDYARRRRLPYQELLPEGLWHDICWQQGILAGRGVKVRVYRCWLFERLTGSPAILCPDALDSAKFASTLAELPRQLTPTLGAALDHAARMFLDEQGLHHEPVSWQPTLQNTDGAQARWGTHEIAQLHTMIVDGNRSMTAAAVALHTTVGVVRTVLSEYPPPPGSV
ncbi:TniQ family protein [Mycobacterium sp. NPDC003323]